MDSIPDWIEEKSEVLANPARERFAQEYVKTANASEAYRLAYPRSAGWKPRTLWNKASELKNSDEVLGRVKYLLKELERTSIDETIASRDEVGRFLTKEMRNDEGERQLKLNSFGLPVIVEGKPVYEDIPHAVRIKAAAELSKMLGYEAPKKVELKNGGVTDDYKGPPQFAEMTTEELLMIAGESAPCKKLSTAVDNSEDNSMKKNKAKKQKGE